MWPTIHKGSLIIACIHCLILRTRVGGGYRGQHAEPTRFVLLSGNHTHMYVCSCHCSPPPRIHTCAALPAHQLTRDLRRASFKFHVQQQHLRVKRHVNVTPSADTSGSLPPHGLAERAYIACFTLSPWTPLCAPITTLRDKVYRSTSTKSQTASITRDRHREPRVSQTNNSAWSPWSPRWRTKLQMARPCWATLGAEPIK